MSENKKKCLAIAFTLLYIAIFTLSIDSLPVYANQADGKTVDNIDEKLEEQNKDIIDAVKEVGVPSNEEKIEEVLNLIEKSTQKTGTTSNLKEIKTKIIKGFFNIALTLRRYAVPFYMFILVTNIIALSILGAKSLKKRKGYIVGSAITTVVFVILMNIPIFIIYFQSNPFSEVVTLNTTHNSLYRLVYFLRNNSIALCAILYIYGVINIQLGKKDIPKKVAGSYLKKTALGIFAILQLLPFAINFIL